MDELVKVAIFMVLFGILLPTFDTYSDGYFSYSLISGTYCETSICVKHPIYGSVMLIPVLLAMLFTIPHWWRREKGWNRLYTLPLLIFQVWPQWQVMKVLKLMKDGNSNWRMEKEKLEKEIGSLEPFLESLPQVHLIMAIVLRGPKSLGSLGSQSVVTFLLSVFSACFGMSKFFNYGPSRLIPYDKMNLGFFVLMVNIASCFIGKALILVLADGQFDKYRLESTSQVNVLIWCSLSLLPQMIFALITMCASLGMRKAIKTVINFPAMILTPAFSYWVFGPIESSSSCCKTTRTTRIGVSFLHSWINAVITIAGQVTYVYLVYSRSFGWIYGIMALGLHFVSVLMLALIQLLERCDKDSCCPSSCCKSTIQRTVLDVDDPSRQIFFRQREDEAREMDDLNNA